jgi:glycosyltransferase involved in cell wall biosynthesis
MINFGSLVAIEPPPRVENTAAPYTLTIGIPCLNEALTVGKVVDDFRRVFPKARILVIDNRSTDDTAQIALAHGAEVIREARAGKGHAVQTLFCAADSDYLLMVDGDDTYPAEEGTKLLDAMIQNGADTVVGRRVSDDSKAFRAVHAWANDVLAELIQTIFRTPVGDLFSGYRRVDSDDLSNPRRRPLFGISTLQSRFLSQRAVVSHGL